MDCENGNKVFAFVYTTKPTGQGTGLGLSLVDDIVRGYGGVPIAIGITVNAKETRPDDR